MNTAVFCVVLGLLAGNLLLYRRSFRLYPIGAVGSILLGFAGVFLVRLRLAEELRRMQEIYVEVMGPETAAYFFRAFARFELGTAVFALAVSGFCGWMLVRARGSVRARRMAGWTALAAMALTLLYGVFYSLLYLSKAFHFGGYILAAAACRLLLLLVPFLFCWAARAQLRKAGAGAGRAPVGD